MHAHPDPADLNADARCRPTSRGGALRGARLLLFVVAVVAGCSQLAVQPDTPARKMDVRGLRDPSPIERYYVLIFSSQNEIKQPRYTHTWMTGVRQIEAGPGQPPLEQHTISWMPATLEIHPLRHKVEPGVNLNLVDTINKVAIANKEEIALWGPYECRPALYARLLVQKTFMESGKMGYQCVDTLGEAAAKGNGCNCIHAITDMDPEHGRRQYRLTRYGFSAGLEITRRLRELDELIHPERTHDFLIPALGLQGYTILRGDNEDIFSPSRAILRRFKK